MENGKRELASRPPIDKSMAAGSSRVRLYILAILALCAFATLFVLGITLIRPELDNMPLIIVMLGIFTPILGGLLAAALKENHDAMNSRLTELLRLTAAASRAEGELVAAVTTTTVAVAREEGKAAGVEQERVRGT